MPGTKKRALLSLRYASFVVNLVHAYYTREDFIAKGHIKNKSCLNEEKENTGIRCNEPQQQILPSGTR